MLQRFGAESLQEDVMNTAFPDNRRFYNLPEGPSRHSSEEVNVNDGATGHSSLTSINCSRLDAPHWYNHSVDPTFLHRQSSHSSSAMGGYQFQFPGALVTDAPQQGPPQAVSFAAEAEGSAITETGLNSYSSHLTNLPALAPASTLPSHVVRCRLSTQRRRHASGSVADRSDPHYTSGFSSVGMEDNHHNATSVAEYSQRRGRRHTSQRLSNSSISAPAISASLRFQPYEVPCIPIEAGHGQSSLAPLSTTEPVGLQPTPSQDDHLKLSVQEHNSRSDLLRNESWFKDQAEEHSITEVDEFVKREYVSSADRSRFSAFVGINPGTKKAVCRITHDITVKGDSVPCTCEWANVKEAVAHVSEYFGYKAYKCKSTEPGHPDPCNKRFLTRERRNDHQSKATRRPDARINCAFCNKDTLERNMERHEKRCKGKTKTQS